MRHIHIFMWERHFWQRMARIIQDVILKMLLIHLTNCAERTAFFKAVSEGVKEFQAICVVGGRDGVLTGYAAPCGVCRQVMMEFCDPETFQIILAVSKDKYDVFTLRELFPLGFGPADLA